MFPMSLTSVRRIFCLALPAFLACAKAPALAGWVIVGDQNRAESKDIPAGMAGELIGDDKRSQAVKSVAFTRTGGWAVISGKDGFAGRNVPDKAFAKLGEFAKKGVELKSIAFAPKGGWVILYEKSGVEVSGIPEDAAARLSELVKTGAEVKCVAFSAAGGWAVLFNESEYAAHGIPEEAEQKLAALSKDHAKLKAIAFAPGGGWAILDGKNGYFCRNVEDEAFKQLGELARQGAEIKSLAFTAELLRLSQDDQATRTRILARMAYYKVPAMGIAVIQDNRMVFARGYGVVEAGGAAVNEETRFQAGSVSKPVAALGVLRLVQEGKLTLDDDLNGYLVAWKIKENEFTAKKAVTLREVLSHTAGFNVHGFGGYAVGERVPTLVEVLNGAPPANSPAIRVVTVPGTKFEYSGGGISVMQQAVIDVTHEPFAKTMREKVLGPLEMKNSTYEQPLPRDWQAVAAVGHQEGKPIAGKWHTYPELAAAGLWTTPSDLARYVIALQHAGRGDPGALLSPELAKQMLTKQNGPWGLGIQVDGTGPTLRFSHNGRNLGFLTQMIGYVQGGQGVVVMINNDTGNSGALMQEMIRNVQIEYGWPE